MNKYSIYAFVSILLCGCLFPTLSSFAAGINDQRIELNEAELKEARESRLCFYKMDESDSWKYTDSFQIIRIGYTEKPILCQWNGDEWYRVYDSNNYILLDHTIFGTNSKTTIQKFIQDIPYSPDMYDYAMFRNNVDDSYQIAYRKNNIYYYINDESVDETTATKSFFFDGNELKEALRILYENGAAFVHVEFQDSRGMIGTWLVDDDKYLTCFPEQIIDSNLYIMDNGVVLPYAKTIQELLYTFSSDNGCIVDISDDVFTISNIIVDTSITTSTTHSTNTTSSTIGTMTDTTEISSSTSSGFSSITESENTSISSVSAENSSADQRTSDDSDSSFSLVSIIILFIDIVLLGIVVLLFRK